MPIPNLPAGAPCWIDLMTSDPEKSQAFYTALFGWTYQTGDVEKYGGYTIAAKDGKSVAGLMKNDASSGYPDVWTTYLRTKDIAKTAELTTANGGQIFYPPMDVPEQGKMMMIGDAGGAAVGVWEFGGHTGFELHDEPGAPAWYELHTRGYAEALPFYRDVFGWQYQTVSDTPEFRYSTALLDGQEYAGMIDAAAFLPGGVPSSWQVYFTAADTDATVATALELGGQVVQEAEDTPYGRLASLSDPTGALFKVVQGFQRN